MKDNFILTPYFLDKPLPGLVTIAGPDWQVNKTRLPNAPEQLRMAALYEPLARDVSAAIQSGNRPVSIAGDCCAAMGVAAGLQRAGVDPILIWFDAHGDFNTRETSPSGFLGGMPLAMLVGRGEQTIPEAIGLKSLSEKQVFITDARDLDPGEKRGLEESNITRLATVSDLIDYPLPPLPIHLHLDVDVINPTVAPSVDYPAPGGPDESQMESVFRFLAGTGRIAAVSVSTWNPELDKQGKTAEVCLNLLQTILSG
ncbi:MAG: arginase family protein [Fidelibacterota bacterium]